MTTNDPYGYYQVPPPGQLPPGYPGSGGLPAGQPARSRWSRDRRALLGGFAAGALASALAFGGLAATHGGSTSIAGAGSVSQLPSRGGTTFPTLPNTPFPGGSSSPSGSATPASAKQAIGVVTVVSVLKYQNAESAGTGMILTSDGDVLTNNHVVDGATHIVVTVESTGKSYTASVVGTAPTRDVALLKLDNASGLQTAALAGSSSAVSVGDAVTGVGNAGGTGTLTQAPGTVTGLQRTITASDDSGANSERLHDLIQTNAGIISGDSGGPLYDSAGQVVGMDTAANASGTSDTAYAIPISDAMSVVRQIETGVETSSIHIGLPGFLGVGPLDSKRGVVVQSVLSGGPAARAGIRPGAVIESIDGTTVHNATALHNLLSAKGPGTSVTVDWLDKQGRSHSATVSLATGPAD
jgi:S1-C subfamily serine protease